MRGALQRLWRRPAAVAPAPTRDWDVWWRERGEGELRCILMAAWDPVGVAPVASAWDEYDAYMPAIVGLLRAPADRAQTIDDLADLIETIATEVMCVQPEPREAYVDLGIRLLAWRTWSFDYGGRPPDDLL